MVNNAAQLRPIVCFQVYGVDMLLSSVFDTQVLCSNEVIFEYNSTLRMWYFDAFTSNCGKQSITETSVLYDCGECII